MLLLPLLSDFLLLDHDLIGALLITFVPLFGFEKLILQMGHLDVAFIVQLVDSSMEHNLEAVQLRNRALFLVTKLIDELSETLVVVKVALIVAHIAVQLDLLLMSKNSSLLSLVLDLLKFLFQLLILALIGTDFLLAHGLMLVDSLVVGLVLDAGVLLEGPPLVLQLANLLSERISVHPVPL